MERREESAESRSKGSWPTKDENTLERGRLGKPLGKSKAPEPTSTG